MTRIKDIARMANVSEAAVSLTLNQKPGVSVATRERILKIAREMGYGVTKRKALSEKLGVIKFLLISMHGHTVNRDHNTFIADYIEGLFAGAQAYGYSLEVSSMHGIPIEEIISSIKNSILSGVIVLGTELKAEEIKAFSSLSIPYVFLDTFYDFLPYDFVDMNNKDAVYDVILHFLNNGHSNIGFVSSSVETHNFMLRTQGFMETLEKLNIKFKEENYFSVDSTFDGSYTDMLKVLDNVKVMPTALFCSNDIISYGTIKALQEKGFSVPEDVSVVGFDDLPLSSLMEPCLTTIKVPKKNMGELAIELLVMRILEKSLWPPVKIQVNGMLMVRDSVKNISKM
jgi:LacI family transcriptional regulator